MAKKDKDAIFTEYLAELKDAIGEDKWASVEENLIKNEKASAKLRDGVLARSEFSSQMDALRKEREEFTGYQNAEKQKIAGWQKWYGDVSKEAADLQSTVRAYRDAYGEIEDGQPKVKPGMSQEDFDKRVAEEMQRYSSAAVKFADDLTDIKLNHRDKFKESLNTDEVIKIVSERNIPLKLAYKEYISDKVEAQNKEEFQVAIKKAREEGAQEALSKHNLPNIDNSPTIRPHAVDAMNQPTAAKDRVAAAVRAFRESQQH